MQQPPTHAAQAAAQQSPPWHKSQTNPAVKGKSSGAPPWRKGVNIYTLVDSWRSYRNDTTNLQSTSGALSGLNAAAPTFQPQPYQYQQHRSVQNYARYPSYRVDKSYRVSNDTRDHQTTRHTQSGRSRRGKKTGQTSTSELIASRLRSANQSNADQPLPSIEQADEVLTSSTVNAAQLLSKCRRVKSRSKTPQQRRTASPEAPQVNDTYVATAKQDPIRIDVPKKLLVILDLNGTLLYRNRASTNRKCHMRPGVTPFVDYLFESHVVMVYTSATAPSATNMVNTFLHPTYRSKLAGVWARDKLDLTPDQYKSKVQVYKKLDKVWADDSIQKTASPGTKWDQSNTVLIDDSKLKALAQPYNLLQVPEYDKDCDPNKVKKEESAKRFKLQQDIIHQLQLKLEDLKYQDDVSQLICKWQEGTVAVPLAPGQDISVEETVDQQASGVKKAQKMKAQVPVKSHLPTPETIAEAEEEDGGAAVVCEQKDVRTRTPVSVHRSVSPIDASVFRGLLSGGNDA